MEVGQRWGGGGRAGTRLFSPRSQTTGGVRTGTLQQEAKDLRRLFLQAPGKVELRCWRGKGNETEQGLSPAAPVPLQIPEEGAFSSQAPTLRTPDCLHLLPARDCSFRSPTCPAPAAPSTFSPLPATVRRTRAARPPYHARRGAAPPPARRLCVSAVCCGWTRSSGPGSEGGVSRGMRGVSELTAPAVPPLPPPPSRLNLPFHQAYSPSAPAPPQSRCLWVSQFLFPPSLLHSLQSHFPLFSLHLF